MELVVKPAEERSVSCKTKSNEQAKQLKAALGERANERSERSEAKDEDLPLGWASL